MTTKAKKPAADTAASGGSVQVVMLTGSWTSKEGDVRELDADTAARLIRERLAAPAE